VPTKALAHDLKPAPPGELVSARVQSASLRGTDAELITVK
jgi:hypothetical protein